MEVSAEAKRIMVVALGKLYGSRTQRGGLRLHRSLLLTLVMKSARDIYHAAQTTAETLAAGFEEQPQEQQHHPAAETNTEPRDVQEPRGPAASPPAGQAGTSPRPAAEDDKENTCPFASTQQHTRKRRGKATVEPDFLPCKKAKLEYSHCAPQLLVSSVLDYVSCSSELGTSPAPIPLHTAIAAC
ncbi:immediate early response gene 2 protein [Kryptolebias marmoratus]|uniref:Immediate early response gene 2 protein-like n=1 Tax=Kryptolebias marmoratus TaxID=37003 RepID=A0A3Q3EJ56_KRYMA|nr:immediate early response gene 2 protein [Kryptolebias marmoratus]